MLLAIVANCVFMAQSANDLKEDKTAEYTFTAIYTVEAIVKAFARGVILADHTLLRDPWNWLDVIVLSSACVSSYVSASTPPLLHSPPATPPDATPFSTDFLLTSWCLRSRRYVMMMVSSLGNMTSLRTLRVLRALKSVTALPGLRIICTALIEAVQRLRDVRSSASLSLSRTLLHMLPCPHSVHRR